MGSKSNFFENIANLREHIKTHNSLPNSTKKETKYLYSFINRNEKLDSEKNIKKYQIWMMFLEENYDLFEHSYGRGRYKKTCENLWLYLLNKCSFLNERPEDPNDVLYKWFHFNNKNLNDGKKNSGDEWYPIKDPKFKEYFKIFLKENPQLAFN